LRIRILVIEICFESRASDFGFNRPYSSPSIKGRFGDHKINPQLARFHAG
jgi:hypothetical protein